MELLEIFLYVTSAAILIFYGILQTVYFFLMLTSLYGAWAQPRSKKLFPPELLDSVVAPPVTLLVPAHNEEATIVESTHALLGLRYPSLEVRVINDGSTDDTLQELIRSFSLRRADVVYHPVLATKPVRGVYVSSLEPRLLVIDKEAGGKSDALNAGINLVRTPWICSVDADSILEEDALRWAMRPVIEDNTVVASCGIVRIANGCWVGGGRVLRVGLPRGRLTVFQVVEYLRGFLGARLGWSWMNALLIISGAFGIFRTDVLRAIGGYSPHTVGEDMEIVVRIHCLFRERKQPYRVVFVPDPVCWTQVPTQAGPLRRQRRRWQRGLAEVLALHRDLFFRPSMGTLGFLALPYFALELSAPLVEILGYVLMPLAWGLGLLPSEYFQTYLVLAFLLGILFSVWAVVIEEFTYRRYVEWRALLRLLLFALVEHVGYHQLLLWWRLEGTYDYVRGRREWGEQVRAGFRRRVTSNI